MATVDNGDPGAGGGATGGTSGTSKWDTPPDTPSVITREFSGDQGYGTYISYDGGHSWSFLGGTKPPNVSVSVGPGAGLGSNRYTTFTDAAGNLWQVDNADGSRSIIMRAPSFTNPADKNNDGLDDTTNMALGVYRDNNSPSGYFYAGNNGVPVPVLPNGAPYNGPDLTGGSGGSLKTINIQGPQGYGTYILKDDGTLGNFIGDPRAPSTSGGVSGSGARVSTGGGGDSGAATAMINAAARAASDAAQAADNAANRQFQAEEAAKGRLFTAEQAQLDRQLRAAEMAATNEYQRAQIQNQRAQLAVQAQKQFADLVSTTDPLAFSAFMQAGGGNLANALAGGGTALSDKALVPAANTLALLNNGMGLTDLPAHDANWFLNQLNGGTGGAPTTGGGLPTGGTPGGAGGDTNTGGGLPTGGTGTDTGTGSTPPTNDPLYNLRLENYLNNLANNFGVTMANFDVGSVAGVPMSAGQRNQLANLAYQNYAQGEYGDKRAPYVTNQQIADVLGTTYGGVKPGGLSVPAVTNNPDGTPVGSQQGVSPDAYNTASTAPGGSHIDINTGRLVPNAEHGIKVGGLPHGPLQPVIVGDKGNQMRGTEELALLAPGSQVLSHEDAKRVLGGHTGMVQAMGGGLPRMATGGTYTNGGVTYSYSAPSSFTDPYVSPFISGADSNPVIPSGFNYTPIIPDFSQLFPQFTYTPPPAPAPAPAPVVQPAPQPAPTPAPVQQPAATQPPPASGSTVTPPPPTPSAPPPAPTGSGVTPPATGGLPTTTTSPSTPPLNSAATGATQQLPSSFATGNIVTPENQAYVDFVRNLRTNVQFPQLNPYAVDYQNIDPITRDVYEKGMQDKFGIPQQALQFEQQKYQLRGLPRAAMAVGY